MEICIQINYNIFDIRSNLLINYFRLKMVDTKNFIRCSKSYNMHFGQVFHLRFSVRGLVWELAVVTLYLDHPEQCKVHLTESHQLKFKRMPNYSLRINFAINIIVSRLSLVLTCKQSFRTHLLPKPD